MAIRYMYGSIFDSKSEVLINPVNTVGIMGAGLAKQFKERYPEMYRAYKKKTNEGYWKQNYYKWAARLMWYKADKLIICLPTKEDWRNPSPLSLVSESLQGLGRFCKAHGIKSVAIPMLGCGLGGLNWDAEVHPLVEREFLGNGNVLCEVWTWMNCN